jgi:dTMP kinase
MNTSEPRTGFFITIEGCDGVGKTTHSLLLAESLKKSLDVVSIREPGGTKTGELIRNLVKGKIDVSPMAELLLFQAARAELVEKIIKPALLAKKIVIADRFIDSTIAYQGYGRGIKIDDIHILNGISSNNIIPNVSILLDIPISKSLNRSKNRDQKRQMNQTRFEDESIEFHKKVRHGFRSIAKENPARWNIVNTSENKKLVAKKILNIITAKLDRIYY